MNTQAKYNKNTYIGFLKIKKGGMKIIPGDIDNSIISSRNKILNHLEKVLSGGKSLKEKYIRKYFKALGGKFVRSDMLSLHEERKSSVGGAHKLLKFAARNNLPLHNVLETFKGSAPSLYKELENKISGGLNEEQSKQRSIAAGDMEKDYPVTNSHLNERYKSGKKPEDYYDQLGEDKIIQTAQDVIAELKSTRLDAMGAKKKKYIQVVAFEWIGMLGALIKSGGATRTLAGWRLLSLLLNDISGEAKNYHEFVRPSQKEENIYDVITSLSKEYLCNGGKLVELPRTDNAYAYLTYRKDIVSAVRVMVPKDPGIDEIPKNELVYNPFPLAAKDANAFTAMGKIAKCTGKGGYDRYYDDYHRGGLKAQGNSPILGVDTPNAQIMSFDYEEDRNNLPKAKKMAAELTRAVKYFPTENIRYPQAYFEALSVIFVNGDSNEKDDAVALGKKLIDVFNKNRPKIDLYLYTEGLPIQNALVSHLKNRGYCPEGKEFSNGNCVVKLRGHGGYDDMYNDYPRGGYDDYPRDNYNDYNPMYGGDIEPSLMNFREEIGRSNLYFELNKLRDEINQIRNN